MEYYNKNFEDIQWHADYKPQTLENLCYSERNPINDKYSYCYYDRMPYQDPSCIMRFHTDNLISNIPELAFNTDPSLINSWGLLLIGDILWVANSGNGLLTTYDLTGRATMRMINVFGPYGNIAQPTGLVFNANPNAFPIIRSSNPNIKNKCNHDRPFMEAYEEAHMKKCFPGPANYLKGHSIVLVATRDGTINGYNASIDPNNSILMFDNSKNNSVYTGIAIVNHAHRINPKIKYENLLFVTDFYNRKIDVFDSCCNCISHLFPFIDEYSADPIPEDFAPYNIIYLNEILFVIYVKQDPCNNQYPVSGNGYGYVSIFAIDGTFIRRYISRGELDIPWGLAFVPSIYGYPAGSTMIGNFGNGFLNIYDSDGKYLGNLKNEFNNDLCINGIRSLITNPQFEKIMYWTACNNNYRNTFVGNIYTKFCQ